MLYLSATDAKNQFASLLSTVDTEPVTIQKNGKPIAVITSVADYEQKDAENDTDAFLAFCARSRKKSMRHGMTKQILDSILNET